MDGFCIKKTRRVNSDLPLAKFIREKKNSSILFSRNGRTRDFLSSHPQPYFYQHEIGRLRRGTMAKNTIRSIDSLQAGLSIRPSYKKANWVYQRKEADEIFLSIKERYSDTKNYINDFFSNSVQGVSAVRMWNISVVGSLIFGMFLMTMIYRYLGQNASARAKEIANPTQNSLVLGAEDIKNPDIENEIDVDITEQLIKEYAREEKKEMEKKEKSQKDMENKMREMVKGYPIEEMIPYIAKKDRVVASFLIGIAKKESDWGKHVPVYQGKDCYNYWGFRAKREKMGTGGHTCFDSPKDAVDSVAKRIEFLVSSEKLNTPAKMVVWKCGYDCSWDNPKAVKKWISDVDTYFRKFDSIAKGENKKNKK